MKYSPNSSDNDCSSVITALLSFSAKSVCRLDLLTFAYWKINFGFSPTRVDSVDSYYRRSSFSFVAA